MLHEDYDGQGVYLYEIQRVPPYWGEALLKAAGTHIPTDPRLRIEGRKVIKGIHRRRPIIGASRASVIPKRSGCIRNTPPAPSPSRHPRSLPSSNASPHRSQCWKKWCGEPSPDAHDPR
jgi:hypothetical protein